MAAGCFRSHFDKLAASRSLPKGANGERANHAPGGRGGDAFA